MSGTTIGPLHQFWHALERLPGPAASAWHWRHLLGGNFDSVFGLLTPDEKPARSVPRFDGIVGEYRVRQHGPEDIVGVGRPGERPVPLSRADVTVHRLNPRRLAEIAADALGIAPDFGPVGDLPNTYQVGLYRPLAGFEVPAYLTAQLEESAYRAVVESLLLRTTGGILLLAPTNRHHRVAVSHLLERREGLFLSLEESLRVCDGRWELTGDAERSVAGFRAKLLARLPELERGFVVDRRRFEVRLDGVPCFLGNTNEFRVMECLARSLGEFVEVEVLAEQVWRDEEVDANAIQAVMSSLRKKFRKKGWSRITLGAEPGHYRILVSAE